MNLGEYTIYLNDKEYPFGNENSLSYLVDLFKPIRLKGYSRDISSKIKKNDNGIITLLKINEENEFELHQYRLPKGNFNLIKFLKSRGFIYKN